MLLPSAGSLLQRLCAWAIHARFLKSHLQGFITRPVLREAP
ncbi:hypothetical protein AWB68_00347 [Caballeronia choica]|uniref:Uncharacterized protein n=1 Tax=Caballeronia choica TaxID=326476 RepID=A0A158F683_9BURK|nr:hypothetical protein AWB68_00347 [Caballeronia choica]